MITKIQAAEKATSGGIDTIIVNGTKHVLFELLKQDILCGTLFKRKSNPTVGRKYWMLHALPSSGVISIDQGAAEALVFSGASLLPSGILKISGEFEEGDAVTVCTDDEKEVRKIAKGIVHFRAKDLSKIIGRKTHEISTVLDPHRSDVVIHRENMVLVSG
jgi:glutamate 5-kinase